MSLAVPRRQERDSLFLRSVRAAVLADFEAELECIECIAVLQAAGFPAPEIRRKLGLEAGEYSRANARLTKAAERLRAGGRAALGRLTLR